MVWKLGLITCVKCEVGKKGMPSLAVWHNLARLLGGEFSEKMKFVVFGM